MSFSQKKLLTCQENAFSIRKIQVQIIFNEYKKRVTYRSETICCGTSNIWANLPEKYNVQTFLLKFKEKLKN